MPEGLFMLLFFRICILAAQLYNPSPASRELPLHKGAFFEIEDFAGTPLSGEPFFEIEDFAGTPLSGKPF